MAIAARPRNRVDRDDSADAATVTGPTIRIENRVVEAARQMQHQTKLQHVEKYEQHGLRFAQPLVFRVNEEGNQVTQHRHADNQETEAHFEIQRIDALRNEQCGKLPGDCPPTQQNQCPQTNPIAPVA